MPCDPGREGHAVEAVRVGEQHQLLIGETSEAQVEATSGLGIYRASSFCESASLSRTWSFATAELFGKWLQRPGRGWNELVKRIMFVASQFNFNYDFSPQKRRVAASVKLYQWWRRPSGTIGGHPLTVMVGVVHKVKVLWSERNVDEISEANFKASTIGVKTVATATLAVKLEVRMSKKLAMPKDATLSKEMMKIVRMRLMGLKMRSPPKVEVKPKVLHVRCDCHFLLFPHTCLLSSNVWSKYSFWR